MGPEILEKIQGTGTGGRVTKQDVLAYAGPGDGGSEEIIIMDHMKKAMAEHMVKSVHTSPHAISVSEVDMSKVVAFRDQAKDGFERKHGVRLTYTYLIAHAMLHTIREFPFINSSVDGDRIVLKKYVNLGVAVATERGLIVPVLRGAHALSFAELAKGIYTLSEKARQKRLVPDDVTGGTITLTNNGTFGNVLAIPIINQPQVAILAFCAIEKRAVVIAGDTIEARPMMYLSLAYDHRVVDGATGGGFVQRVADHLESFQPPEW